MVGQQLLHYQILEKLGEGGMGVVYKAQDTKLNRLVALKLLPEMINNDEDVLQRFRFEAQAAASLNHPNIATIYAIEETGAAMFIVMEYIEGQELRRLIKSNQLPIQDVTKIAIQIAEGLQIAHEKGIVHRDIKSSNIMLHQKGMVKIMDFGLAKVQGRTHITRMGTTLGTVSYMSPEQSRGEAVDHRSDIWALGVVMYEMVTGKLPFRGDYDAAVIYGILNEEPAPVLDLRSDVPERLNGIVAKALEKQVEQRYQSISDLLQDLYELQPQARVSLSKTVSSSDKPVVEKRNSSSARRTSSLAERRQVTAVYCRVIPVSPLEDVDPEELHDTLPNFYKLCEKVVQGFDGYIAPSVGEGVLILLGYPQAHEDDARRAALIGLGIIDGLQQDNQHRSNRGEIALAVQVGIHTGLMVFGQKAEKESQSMIGDAPEIAIKLSSMAAPNSILTTKTNIPMLEKDFDHLDLGEHAVLGSIYPIHLYQILHQSAARSRFDDSFELENAPLIGRESEYNLLKDGWERLVEDGEGRVVLLNGDAGLGKSHLVRALKRHIRQHPKAWLAECFCSAYHKNSPLFPIVDFLERVAIGFKPEDRDAERLQKLEAFLTQYGHPLAEAVPLLGSLLNVPFDQKYAPLKSTPERQKQKTYEILSSLLIKRAQKQPLLFVVEDLHWADPSTLELLSNLVELGPTAKIYSLFTCRPDFTPPWPQRSHVAVANLVKLKKKNVLEIIHNVTRGKSLPEEVTEEIIAKTDGVPLFVEEVTKSVMESKVLQEESGRYVFLGKKKRIAIPTTLRDSLMARLDRLGTAKEVAQLGSVIGREFSFALLHAIMSLDENILSLELEKLVDSELLYKSAGAEERTFIFKHALIQDAAYDSILKKMRHQLHEEIAQKLVQLSPGIQDNQPELLAYHHSAAEQAEKAIPLWLKAGQLAYSRSANKEAIVHFNRGLELVNAQPESAETLQQELIFHLNLGMSLIAIKGYTDPNVEKSFTRARAICAQFGQVPQLFPALWGLWAFHIVRREFDVAHQLGEEMLHLATQTNDTDLLLEAHTSNGQNFLYSKGEFETSKQHFEQAFSYYSPEKHKTHIAVYLQDPGVVSLSHLSWLQWILGEVDQAIETKNRVVRLAEELGHPFSLSYALTWASVLHAFLLQPEKSLEYADRVLAVATENIFPNWIADGEIVHGWALARLGNVTQGIEQLERGKTTWHLIGARLWQTHILGLLTDVLNESDQIEKGLQTVEEALETVAQVKETYYEAELWRLKGELLLKQGAADQEAEQCFVRAKQIAAQQKAKLFELRATLALARLWKSQNQTERAKQELKLVSDSIIPSQDIADLQHARQLLRELE